MPITYSFDAAQDLIHTAVTGDVRPGAIEDHLRAICAEPWFPAPALVDTRLAEANISSAEIRAVVEVFRKLGPRFNHAAIAVIVGSDVAFGLVRMIELMLDDVITITPFRDTASALAWLAESRARDGLVRVPVDDSRR
jgi:hypothetical protein